MNNKLLMAFLLGMIFFLLLGYTRDWTESTPTDATVANQIDDYNRYVRVDVAERLEDYIGGFNASDTNAGFYHILFIENAASLSTPAANKGLLYGLLASSKCELAWMDEDGDEVQLTSGGYLNGAVLASIPAGAFDANAIDSDDYADGSIDAAHLAADIIDETKIADDGIDSEHYNDGSIDAVHIANLDPDAAASGTVSVTLPNGVIMKWGSHTGNDGADTVTFATAFPTACYQVVACIGDTTGDSADSIFVHTLAKTGFSIYARTNAQPARWIAFGY